MKFGILFGGNSYEHEISIVSAISLKKILGSEVGSFVFLDCEGEFYLIENENMKSSFFSSFEYKKSKKLSLKQGGFFAKSLFGESRVDIPTLINLVHGGDGEDGVLSGMLGFFGVRYIGPRVDACAISYDKGLTKIYSGSRGVETLQYEVFNRESKIDGISYPCIIKPLRLGSSIGISVVNSQEELSYSLDSAFEFDTEVIVEPFISGVREYNLAGFIGNGGEWVFSIVEEPQKGDLLGFEDKYLDFSRTDQISRANLSEEVENALKESFKRLYVNKFEGALVRCDFFVIDSKVYLNEINPIPGSMANYLFDDFGSKLEELSENLPKKNKIKVDYKYIHNIQRAKGKA